jgi:hypothetical protein
VKPEDQLLYQNEQLRGTYKLQSGMVSNNFFSDALHNQFKVHVKAQHFEQESKTRQWELMPEKQILLPN